MSSLQFLNKKSWHVGTKKNEEKVWLREQAAGKEAARIAELQKQLNGERKLEEIQRLERESGRSAAPARAPRLDWMYEGPGAAMPGTPDAVNAAVAAAKQAQEDALLGKTEAALPGAAAAGAGGAKGGALAAAVVDDDSIREELALRDAEAKLREDPLLAIKRRHVEQVQKVAAAHGGGGVVRSVERRRPPSAVAPRGVSQQRPPVSAEKVLRQVERQARKEQRARIREERRVKREGKEDAERCELERPEGRKRPRGGSLSDEEECVGSKRAHREEDKAGHILREAGSSGASGYGLCVPAGGTRVAVQRRFEPSAAGGGGSAMPASAELPPRAPRRSRPQSQTDREELLASMRADAERLSKDRAVRLEQHRREEQDERRRQSGNVLAIEGGPKFMREFARDALDKAEHMGGVGSSRRRYGDD